ncbi:MAG: helix-turn-helix domain-containing protein [Faecalicatena sp.]|uniref:helix-turn-helix domain-containing protein n=1 Tax=Faecalicatena sp. TaxID=2005360 RepID=UPI0025898747|nr:helix-turn-helix transcriptional regulator [Faecalicatena sp.]MCI6464724.1 helix-turn-helix domain-containing protein [Faecalicatena sp.]MDY5618302.1 helix-turn-helix transcriptional regulator [Lachnospiraceae bacterium]
MKVLLADIIYNRNLSIRQVSILTGVPKSTIGDILNGTMPRIDTLEDIAKGLHVRITDLIDSPYK